MNLDKLRLFPDQRDPAEHDPFECVGLTMADVLGNVIGQPCDPDFPYSLGFYITGTQPADPGVDIYPTMLATMAFAILPVSLETWTAKTTSELYAANFLNFTKDQVQAAQKYAQNGVRILH